MRILAALALCWLAAMPGLAAAQSANDAILARRGFYQLLGFNFGPLVAMARGERAFDAAEAETFAANLTALAAYDIPNLFPGGTSNADMPGETRALPAIWSNPAGVAQRIAEFRAAVAVMAEAAPQGQPALGGAIATLGGTCSACHNDFRARAF